MGNKGWRKTLEVRLYGRIKLAANGCHEWQGAIDHDGYGVIGYEGKVRHVHRLVWELHRGKITSNLHLHHCCENKICCNSDHLELLTPGDHKRIHTAKITSCPKNHPYNKENTYICPRGKRYCKICRRQADKKRYEAKRNQEEKEHAV